MAKKEKVKKLKKKIDWSKIFTTGIALCFGIYGIWCGIEYYILCNAALASGAEYPDPTLAVTCVSVVISSLMSYLLYNGFLKNSRNKYGVDAEGVPYDKIAENVNNIQEKIEDIAEDMMNING